MAENEVLNLIGKLFSKLIDSELQVKIFYNKL